MKTKKRLIALAAAAMLFGSLTVTPAEAAYTSGRINCYNNTTAGVHGAKYGRYDLMIIKLGGHQFYRGYARSKTVKSNYRSTNWSVSAQTLEAHKTRGTCIVYE